MVLCTFHLLEILNYHYSTCSESTEGFSPQNQDWIVSGIELDAKQSRRPGRQLIIL